MTRDAILTRGRVSLGATAARSGATRGENARGVWLFVFRKCSCGNLDDYVYVMLMICVYMTTLLYIIIVIFDPNHTLSLVNTVMIMHFTLSLLLQLWKVDL